MNRMPTRSTPRWTVRVATLFALAFALSSTPASAQWTRLMQTSKGHTIYLDPQGISREGDIRRLVELWDYLTPDGFGDLSSRLTVEINCTTGQRRVVKWEGYKANMAAGALAGLRAGGDGQWRPIAQGTVSQAVMGAACL